MAPIEQAHGRPRTCLDAVWTCSVVTVVTVVSLVARGRNLRLESERVASGQKVACDATLGWSSARASSTSLCAPPAPSEDSPCQCEMYRSRRGRSGGGATQMPPYQRPLSSLRSWVRTKARRQRRQRRRTRTQPTRSMTELFLSPTTTKRGGVTRVTRVEGAPVGRVEGTCRKRWNINYRTGTL